MRISKKSDQRGIGHLLMIGLAVVVIAVVGLVGWKVMSNSNNKNNSNTNSSASTQKTATNTAVKSACDKAISDANICNFAAHYNPNSSYKATDTSTTSDGTSSLTIATDGKGNSEITSTGGGTTGDYISLDGSTYIKDSSSGTWIKYSAASNTPTTNNPASGLKISSSDITGNGTISYKNLGTQACGSLTCYKYQIIDTTSPGTTQYVWFDNKNYQLHEFYAKDATSTNDMTFDYQSISITAPSPVQDFSASSGNPY